MSKAIAKSTCLIHLSRPATARCPECKRFFCGECITEHDGRLTCAECLRDGGNTEEDEEIPWLGNFVFPVMQVAAGVLTIWALFYIAARFLMLMPAAFHDGTVWE